MKLKALFFIPFIVSFLATMGSLYFSEIQEFAPCELCWYQRILMYPLVVLFFLGFVNKNKTIYSYTLPLSFGGMLIALYHYGIQKVDFLSSTYLCTSGVHCGGEYINWFGFVTIPFLSLVSFVFIFIFSLLLVRRRTDS